MQQDKNVPAVDSSEKASTFPYGIFYFILSLIVVTVHVICLDDDVVLMF